MTREEWLEELQAKWNRINGDTESFSDHQFSEEPGDTADEARAFIRSAYFSIDQLRELISITERDLEDLERFISDESLIDKED